MHRARTASTELLSRAAQVGLGCPAGGYLAILLGAVIRPYGTLRYFAGRK